MEHTPSTTGAQEGITVVPLGPGIGAEVGGVDISAPVSDAAFAAVLDAFHQHAVIVIRKQTLTPRDLFNFSKRFGALDVHHLTEHTLPDLPQVRILSNVKKDGKLIGAANAGRHWHSDLSYKDEPAAATLLYGVETPPEGADTLFANMNAAYEALSEDRKRRVTGKSAVHDRNFRYSEMYPDRPPLTEEQLAAVRPVSHPAVRTHPVTGRPSLYVSKNLVSEMEGLPTGDARQLVEEIEAFATQPRFVYRHEWRQGDLLIWDNRCTLHRATPFSDEHRRVMHRTQVKGDKPFFAP